MPSTEFLILLGLVLAGFAYFFFERRRTGRIDTFEELRTGIHTFRETLQSMEERIDRVFTGVSKDLGRVQEIGRQMQDLQAFLRSPKFRGNIGEELLRDLLEQHLPRDHFFIQHSFRDGQIVDAVIKTRNGLIPIDAKFPLENFRKLVDAADEASRTVTLRDFLRDVRRHIDAISAKYILPAEGTVDFAVMYIPSEALYYELLMQEGALAEYARERKVFLVSPNSFYYFLQTIVLGLQQQQYAEGARRVLAALAGISQTGKKLGGTLRILSRHLTNAKNAADTVEHEFRDLTSQIQATRLISGPQESEPRDERIGS